MNDEQETIIPETRPTGFARSTLLLAAMQAFIELERGGADPKKEEALLAEYSELVVVPGVLSTE